MKVRVNLTALFWSICALFFIIKLTLALKPHVVFWDEAVYIGMGKYLYSSGTAGLWEILRPIGLPIFLGALWKLNLPIINAGGVLSIVFSIGYIILIYKITERIFNKKIAAWAGIIALLSPLFFLYTGAILTGIPSMFFVLLSIYFITKKQIFFAGIAAGAAFLTRFPQGLIFLAIVTAFVITKDQRKNIIPYFAGTLITTIPFFIFNYTLYRNDTTPIYALIRPLIFAFSHQANPFAPGGSPLFYVIELIKNSPLLIFSIIGIIIYFKKKLHQKPQNNLIFIPLLLYLTYFSLIPNKQLRFAVAFLPFLAIAAAYGITWLRENYQKQWIRNTLAIIVTLFILISINTQSNILIEQRQSTNPSIVNEFYQYQDYPPGPILTADPVPTAYTNKLYIPYYFSVDAGTIILKDNMDHASAIIYAERSFPCLENDTRCKKQREELKNIITKNRLVFNNTYFGDEYLIYAKN